MSDAHVEKDSEVFHCIFWYHKPTFILTLLCLVVIVYYGPSVLKGRVHGLAHAHESKCCFFARARCSEHTSNIVS